MIPQMIPDGPVLLIPHQMILMTEDLSMDYSRPRLNLAADDARMIRIISCCQHSRYSYSYEYSYIQLAT